MLAGQLFVPDMSLHSIPVTYLWRKSLVEKYGYFRHEIGDSVFPYVVVGKDGWLYFTGELSLRNYQKVDPLNMSSIKRLTKILNEIKEQTEQYGGQFLLLIPPDKSTVYPQYMPDEIPVLGQISSLDRLIEYLDKNSDIEVVDFRPVFSNISESTEIYYKTDTHWNCLGAYYASNEVLSRISVSQPQIHPRPISDFNFFSEDSKSDMATMMSWGVREDKLNVNPAFDTGLSVILTEGEDPQIASLRITVNDDKDLPKLMVFHDSFYQCLSVFVEPNFSHITSMHFKDAELKEYLERISAEKPDIVIVEFVERYMDFFYEHLSE